MKLYDALRSDGELRDDLAALFERERQATLAKLEATDPVDTHELRILKCYLDALKHVRFLCFKEELNRAPPSHARGAPYPP
jgi:hypothetical protein